jgi:putative tricarboxylic transport membrane protein
MSFDRGVSVGLFVMAGWMIYMAISMPKAAFRQSVGPEVVPIGIALGLMLASVLLFRATLKAGTTNVATVDVPHQSIGEDRVTQLLVILGLVAYVIALEPLGYLVSTALLCIYEAAVFEPKHWVRNILSGVLFATVVYTLFTNVLEVMLPVGILGW